MQAAQSADEPLLVLVPLQTFPSCGPVYNEASVMLTFGPVVSGDDETTEIVTVDVHVLPLLAFTFIAPV